MEGGITSQHVISLINQLGDWVTEHIEKMDKERALSSDLANKESQQPSRLPRVSKTRPGSRAAWPVARKANVNTWVCSILFEKFKDPESSKFWKTRYCMSLSCKTASGRS